MTTFDHSSVIHRAAGWLITFSLLHATACGERSGIGSNDNQKPCIQPRDCHTEMTCGDLVDCVDGFCRPDLPRVNVPCPECDTAADCVIADPFYCCQGCPRIMTSEELANNPCWFDRQNPPTVDPPAECHVECNECPICFPQPLGVDCREQICTETARGCPADIGGEIPETTAAAIVADPEGHAGNIYRVTGCLLPGPPLCDEDCPSANCCDSASLLDGVVPISGSPCGASPTLWSDEPCADQFHTVFGGTPYLPPGACFEFTGRVDVGSGSPADPPLLEVMGVRFVESTGLEGAYPITITGWEVEDGLPSCPDEAPWTPGDQAWVYVTVAADLVKVFAPVFTCDYWGSTFHCDHVGSHGFEGWVPVDCVECCAHHFIESQVSGELMEGTFKSFNGRCRYTVRFQGCEEHP